MSAGVPTALFSSTAVFSSPTARTPLPSQGVAVRDVIRALQQPEVPANPAAPRGPSAPRPDLAAALASAPAQAMPLDTRRHPRFSRSARGGAAARGAKASTAAAPVRWRGRGCRRMVTERRELGGLKESTLRAVGTFVEQFLDGGYDVLMEVLRRDIEKVRALAAGLAMGPPGPRMASPQVRAS